MSTPLLKVENSPFNAEQVALLNQLLSTLSAEQAQWLSGYLAAFQRVVQANPAAVGSAAPAAVVSAKPAQESVAPTVGTTAAVGEPVTVLYGSQTGNAARLAQQLAKRAKAVGLSATVHCMSEFKPSQLKKLSNLLIVVSTHGEGEPPDKAKEFYEFLFSKRAPRLESLRYSVLALGDITYKQFCHTGRQIDQRLAELGAKRLRDRVDCDVDYRESADQWMAEALAELTAGGAHAVGALATVGQTAGASIHGAAGHVCTGACGSNGQSGLVALSAPAAPLFDTEEPVYDRSSPFYAEVIENINLNGRGSDKETRYLKLLLEGSGIRFAPGDSLGIVPENHPALVDDLISEMGWRPDEPVRVGKHDIELREALLQHFELTQLTRPLMEQLSKFSRDGLADMVAKGDADALERYASGRDVLDLVRDFDIRRVPANEFISRLRKMPGRLYSISSSYAANPDEVDLTIAAVRYEAHGRARYGVCSVYCAERVSPGDRVRVYPNENPNFRLPADPDAPIIMVGPGTGVAPFRAFLEEREEQGATGKNWLFFGDRRFRTDFLYQTDWLRWRSSGLLTRIDVAFSRDTSQKVYVQHRMAERAREIYDWLQEGAYFYVCGDQKAMAPDVHAQLRAIVQQQGGLSGSAADDYLAELQRQNRYQRDVY